MDEPPDSYSIENVEQMRAIADRLRVRIVDLLSQRKMTVAQLSEQLQLAHAKVHYHVRELEQVGLVRLVETREKGGILEKYYRSVAKTISVSPTVLTGRVRDEAVELASRLLADLSASFVRALGRWMAAPDGDLLAGMDTTSLFVTKEEALQLGRQISEVLKPYEVPRGVEGEREVMHVHLLFADDAAEGGLPAEGSGAEAVAAEPQPTHRAVRDAAARKRPPQPVAQPAAPRPADRAAIESRRRHVHSTVTAGAMEYSRAQLEGLAARGERLAIYALGAVTFDDDVPAELVDRVIRRARIRGKLQASPSVRAVIERKEMA